MSVKNPTPRRYGRRYPWEDWFARAGGNGGLTLRAGADYNGRADTMATVIRLAAKQRGLRAHVRIAGDSRSLIVSVTEE